MGRPPASRDREPTAERLLDAAEAEFSRAGGEGATLEAIARAVGISRPSLLYHHGSKAALYEAVIRRAFARLGADLSEVMVGEGNARLEGLVARFVQHVDAHPTLAPLVLRELLDAEGPGWALVMRAALPVLEGVEQFLRNEGSATVNTGLSVRAALLCLAASVLVHSASGSRREALWGSTDPSFGLARQLFTMSIPTEEVSRGARQDSLERDKEPVRAARRRARAQPEGARHPGRASRSRAPAPKG